METKIIPARDLKRLGRFTKEETACTLGFSMSGVGLRAACTEVEVEIDCEYGEHSPWMGVLVDGAPVGRFPLRQGKHWYLALAGMDPAFPHEIAIVRDSQPVPEDPHRQFIRIENVRVTGEVQPCHNPAMVIEFAGDSLTSGEGTLGPGSALEWRMAYMSAMNTYAQMVCCALNAEGRWISQSGWGVHAAWDGDLKRCIPLIYEQTCATDDSGKQAYDFNAVPANWVVINLATNDGAPLARLKKSERKAFRQAFYQDAKAFLEQIRRLNPSAHILWAYGMCGRPLEKEIQLAIKDVQDDKAHYLRVPRCRAEEIGSRQHPGQASHRKVAREIVQYIETIRSQSL